MRRPTREELATLYNARDIQDLWTECRNLPIIQHPDGGWISPNELRATYKGQPCPFCGKEMVQGKTYITNSRQEAIARGYQYIDKQGKEKINKIGSSYFHQNYVNLDHIINKARCPELLFDYDNLQGVCFRCNSEKSDDNTYEARQGMEQMKSMAVEARKKYVDDI